MADEADVSDIHVEARQAIAIYRVLNQPAANIDADGNKICLDCDDVIPKERAAISVVIRCIDCQVTHEKEAKI